jgi:DNA-binding LacI/PurR family transcriptional regulator
VLKKSNLIGLLVPSVSYSFYPDIIESLQRKTKAAGYNLILAVSNEDPYQEKEEIDLLLSIPVDGIIIIPTSSDKSEKNCASVVKANVPLVMADRYFSTVDASYVVTDAVSASRNIVQYLIDLGHRRIAHVGGPLSNSFAREVKSGYVSALKENTVAADSKLLFSGSMDGAEVPDIMGQILDMEDRPTAIQAVNDINAIHIMEECKRKRLKIPRDVSLVGFSDVRAARLLEVPLTTVREHGSGIGEEAARILIGKLDGRIKRKVCKTIDGELIIRRSARAVGPRSGGR